MIHNLELKPLGAGQVVQFTWDSDAGTLTGRDAALIQSLVDEAIHHGDVLTDPYPSVYTLQGSPLHNVIDMAAVLSAYSLDIPKEWAVELVTAMQKISGPPADFSDMEARGISVLY